MSAQEYSDRRAKASAITRSVILTVARQQFTTHAYEDVNLRTIARFSNRSTGAIFANWNGKEDLFAEAMGRPHLTDARGAELLAHLKAIAPGAADELLSRWAA